jgi:hypothetical protein
MRRDAEWRLSVDCLQSTFAAARRGVLGALFTLAAAQPLRDWLVLALLGIEILQMSAFPVMLALKVAEQVPDARLTGLGELVSVLSPLIGGSPFLPLPTDVFQPLLVITALLNVTMLLLLISIAVQSVYVSGTHPLSRRPPRRGIRAPSSPGAP